MAGSGVIRGDEDRGLLELWLASGTSRARVTAARAGAFVIAVAAAIVIVLLLTGLGATIVGSPLPIQGLLADGAALLATTSACFAIALLVAQFADSRRMAAGVGAIVLLGLFLLNSLGRTLQGPDRFRGVSPFYYYDRTNGLSPGGQIEWASILGLSVAAVALITLAGVAFARRDLGAGLVRPRPAVRTGVTVPSRNPVLRLPVLATIYEQRVGLIAWMVSTALLALFMTSLAKSVADLVSHIPIFRAYVSGQGDLNRAVISVFWFAMMPLVLAVFAVTQVSRWTTDDTEGRLEMVLSAPISRWRVALEREGALLLATTLIAVVGSIVTFCAATSAVNRRRVGAYARGGCVSKILLSSCSSCFCSAGVNRRRNAGGWASRSSSVARKRSPAGVRASRRNRRSDASARRSIRPRASRESASDVILDGS